MLYLSVNQLVVNISTAAWRIPLARQYYLQNCGLRWASIQFLFCFNASFTSL